ncbi:HypC/HybG/HupF family hydrogenase formation chaperone [Vibrio algarum]|uniref:HypC/HybG/HupF family hydrogenase formation chaperone n=1 Tax=Vibrio algarum TaxID=3020714 RepID=A0ABT4YLS3_9VIBR|nr:HypC/HybG/HupF family hydrogenase formation chaperone [Vibrio sp. KJ40-1]MDB1122380.1 HypC/HybG/HupF family hydrogenase formation chaperone [Vibrio sp. KJ40-1]
MCLGIPGKIVEITDVESMLANVEVSGIKREINIACIIETTVEDLVGKWTLVHVGFAMCIIDEVQAKETLLALETMQALDHEVNDFSAVGQAVGDK